MRSARCLLDRLGVYGMNTVSCLNAMRTHTSPRTQQPTTTTTEIVASTGPVPGRQPRARRPGHRQESVDPQQRPAREGDEVVTHHPHGEGAARSAGGRGVMHR
jgi:hypothetical protein